LLDGHFVMEHGARSRSGTFFNFNARPAVRAACAIDDGWRLAARYAHRRYRSLLPARSFAVGSSSTCHGTHIECASELPVEMNAFKAQQARWARV